MLPAVKLKSPGSCFGDSAWTVHGKSYIGEKAVAAAYAGADGLALEVVRERMVRAWDEADAKAVSEESQFRLPVLDEPSRKLLRFFRWCSDRSGTRSMYVRTSIETETYAYTDDPMLSATAITLGGTSLHALMNQAYYGYLEQGEFRWAMRKGEGSMVAPTLDDLWKKHLKAQWEQDGSFRLEQMPTEISADPQRPAFLHVEPAKWVPGPTPAWDGWMEQMPECCRQVFRAWVGSVFDPLNKGRQALWLRDGGYSGKSSVGRALNRYMGGVGVGSISHGSMSDKFGYSSVYGKRLIIYGDNKNARLLSSERVHSLLGHDTVMIERKGIDAFPAIIHARLMVFSNITPDVDLVARNEVSRLCFIPLSEPPEHILSRYCETDLDGRVLRRRDGTPVFIGGNLEDELLSEMGAFLGRCRQDYEELCPHRQDIVVPEPMWELLVRDCASAEHLEAEHFIDGYLEFGEDFECEPVDLKKKWDELGGKGGPLGWSQFKRHLHDAYRVTTETVSVGKRTRRVLRGIRLL